MRPSALHYRSERFLVPRKSLSSHHHQRDGFVLVKIFSSFAPRNAHRSDVPTVDRLHSNLTLKRRDDLLVLVLARYVSTHRVVAREGSRAEWTWYSNSLMTLADVGP